ncbi:MAG: tRNA (N6-threonylcarbamoyladenosine(37)-N6)-methyltransferase TrmO [Bdellovibrionaceae bacterium]|nr:tRNA (N6-threonylcarbamoyladenosine(37)-N6)-methyltransferase TrmO [Pseudobdellovibrionaceae bacterium]
MEKAVELKAIGIYRSKQVHPYEAARQPREDRSHEGEITLESGQGFEQALEGLEGFDRLWLIFQFHHNSHWNPKVMPPRGTDRKMGVFATRAPYRPNALGLSCVRLQKIQELTLTVSGADLLDGTPIFDLKPYVPEADSFPDAKIGWLEGIEQNRHRILWTVTSQEQLTWLQGKGLENLKDFLEQQLEFEPFDKDRKRVSQTDQTNWVLAYRTWRAEFFLSGEKELTVTRLYSGYSADDLKSPEDKWADKELHRKYQSVFGESLSR